MSIETQLADLVGDLPDGMTEDVALGTGLADGYDLYESAIGDIAVTFNPQGVSSVDIADNAFEDRFLDRFGRKLIRAEAPSAWGPAYSHGDRGRNTGEAACRPPLGYGVSGQCPRTDRDHSERRGSSLRLACTRGRSARSSTGRRVGRSAEPDTTNHSLPQSGPRRWASRQLLPWWARHQTRSAGT